GAMLGASIIGILCHSGLVGDVPQALSHFIALLSALVIAPLIAWSTAGRYYLARPVVEIETVDGGVTCCICEHKFEHEDVTYCPAYAGNICSLCCSLDARCNDYCKPGAGYTEQMRNFFTAFLPTWMIPNINARLGHFLTLVVIINGLSAILLSLIYFQTLTDDLATAPLLAATLWKVFFLLVIITGVVSWLFVLAHESRVVAQEETQRQTRLLMEEIVAHERTDKALQEAKENAEAANLAKSRYLTGISHELRSPLNAVLGYAQLLEKDPAIPAHRKDALTVIRRSGEHLADLIEGLLDISKIEAGKLDLHRDQVRVPLLMDQLVQMFRLQAEAKGLEFDYQCTDRLPEFVRTDEKRLRQILINVLSNAVKYTESGKISLTLRYRSQVAEFTVTDTGEGIAAEDMERIFRPFERVRTPGSTATGTGLGLTITRLLADIMGGDIAVKSEPGKGSTFKVSMMLSSISKPQTESIIAPVQTIFGYRGPMRTIMIVDDEASHRQLMRAMLMPLGFDIVEVDNPFNALTTLAEQTLTGNRPDLILLDVSMPDMNGWELANKFRVADFCSPIIMVSADASEGRNQDFMHTPEAPQLHDAYLIKPVRLNLLLDHIGRLLKLSWCYEQTHELPPPIIEKNTAISA